MYDIVIIGAGPAGSTFARLLPKHLKVLLLDKRNLDEIEPKYNKTCGGLISPDAQGMLAKFDLGVPKDVLVDPQLLSVKVIDVDNDIERFYQRNYINIDRERFDRWLVNIVPQNVEKIFSIKFNKYTDIENGYKIEYFKDKQLKSVEAKMIVGADGANSLLRKILYPNTKIKKYVSIQKWYSQKESINHYVAIFDKGISDYYQWAISKDNCLIVGSATDVNDNDPNNKFKRLENVLKNRGYDLSKEVKKEGSFILRPTKLRDVKTGKDNIFLIGEAAGLVSPSSAEGYSYAFRSAMYLARAVNSNNIRKNYQKQLFKLKLNLVYKKMKLPAMYNRFIRGFILKTNLLTIDIEE